MSMNTLSACRFEMSCRVIVKMAWIPSKWFQILSTTIWIQGLFPKDCPTIFDHDCYPYSLILAVPHDSAMVRCHRAMIVLRSNSRRYARNAIVHWVSFMSSTKERQERRRMGVALFLRLWHIQNGSDTWDIGRDGGEMWQILSSSDWVCALRPILKR